MITYYEDIPFIRSIACIMVVLVHTSAIAHSDSYFSPEWAMYVNQLSRLGTPIFAVISAFLLFHSIKNKNFDFKRFLKSRTTKIISPFLLWSAIYLIIKSLYGEDMFSSTTQVENYIFLGTAHYHLYFIITVIQFYIIFPVLQLFRNKIAILFLFIISIAINYWWYQTGHISIGLDTPLIERIINHRSFILNWIAYFMFGAVLLYYYQEIVNFTYRFRYIIFVVFGIVLFFLVNEVQPGQVFTSSREENLIYIPFFIIFLFSLFNYVKRIPALQNSLALIGNYSMGVYLIHPLVVYIIRKSSFIDLFTEDKLWLLFILVLSLSLIIVRLIITLPFANFIIPVGKKKDKTRLKRSAIKNINGAT
ncbi:acyltransferase [Oceanobacillus sojae]|uniref:Putative poly-beta-1,6-N-acetyl-D-glucosamine export protein n=1 Tax=Oceanobacillus sojae TaxID=582851 RepID=A0A511ZQL8_9BACI|nr:acyltransferase [Oceanobacillus sojae]GEN89744.1 putative poly-beta-1,6-N-acetyl-D-glucosamine export protein [Oceanobacillus sojae]